MVYPMGNIVIYQVNRHLLTENHQTSYIMSSFFAESYATALKKAFEQLLMGNGFGKEVPLNLIAT